MALTLISTPLDITVSDTAVATVSVTSGITSTYDSYEFHCVNMHPATNAANFQFQVNAVDLTGFDEVMTTTSFTAYHNEADDTTILAYHTGFDQAQTQLYQTICSYAIGNHNDQSVSGVLKLYAPSSPTYVKHFTAEGNGAYGDGSDYSVALYVAGYINTTAAIDEISFKFSSGNIDAGTIKMFGVS